MRARLAPRQKWWPPPPNATCSVRLAGDVEAERVVEHRLVAVGRDVPHHDLVALRRSPGRGSRVGAVAVRRKWYTGDAQRRISSTAGVELRVEVRRAATRTARGAASAPTCPTRSCCGSSRCRRPASSSMNMSNSSSESCSPSISALISLVTMSSRGSAAPLLRQVVGVRVERGRRLVRALGAALELGVVDADHRVRPLEEEVAVLLGHAHDLGDRLQRELGREVDDEVARAPLDDVVDDERATGGAGTARAGRSSAA